MQDILGFWNSLLRMLQAIPSSSWVTWALQFQIPDVSAKFKNPNGVLLQEPSQELKSIMGNGLHTLRNTCLGTITLLHNEATIRKSGKTGADKMGLQNHRKTFPTHLTTHAWFCEIVGSLFAFCLQTSSSRRSRKVSKYSLSSQETWSCDVVLKTSDLGNCRLWNNRKCRSTWTEILKTQDRVSCLPTGARA